MKCLFICVLLLLVGCERQIPIQTNQTIIDESVILPNIVFQPIIGNYCTESSVRFLFKNSIAIEKNSVHFGDGKLKYINFYLLLDFCKKYKEYKIKSGFDFWRVNFDCDDFAQMFMIFLKMHIITVEENKKVLENPEEFLNSIIGTTLDVYNTDGFAVGEIWFSKKEGQNSFKHAINIIFLGPDNYLFIEPQDCSILELSEDEIKSIYFIRF